MILSETILNFKPQTAQANNNDCQLRQCRCCNNILPITKFMRTGKDTRRHVCNHCFYIKTIVPCRHRAIIRSIQRRRGISLSS